MSGIGGVNKNSIAEIIAYIFNESKEAFRTALGAGKKVGGSHRGTEEWILKRNTLYAFRCTSNADNNVVQMNLDWYEETMVH